MRIALFVLMLGLGGCASTRPLPELDGVDLGRRPLAITLPVPFVEQTPRLCGPTALLMVLRESRPGLTLDDVTHAVYSPDARGTYKQDFLAGARRFGLAPYPVDSLYEMIHHLAHGRPVVVFHSTGFLWKNFWHYSVLTGYDVGNRTFTLHIGPYANHVVSMADVLRSWEEGGRWSYVLLRPEEIPEFARPEEAIDNALAFLRIGLPGAAQRLAEAAESRWPRDARPEIVLADALSRKGSMREALLHLKRAVEKDPEDAALRSKLAALSRRR